MQQNGRRLPACRSIQGGYERTAGLQGASLGSSSDARAAVSYRVAGEGKWKAGAMQG